MGGTGDEKQLYYKLRPYEEPQGCVSGGKFSGQYSDLVLVGQEVAAAGLQFLLAGGGALSECEGSLLHHTGVERGEGVGGVLGWVWHVVIGWGKGCDFVFIH